MQSTAQSSMQQNSEMSQSSTLDNSLDLESKTVASEEPQRLTWPGESNRQQHLTRSGTKKKYQAPREAKIPREQRMAREARAARVPRPPREPKVPRADRPPREPRAERQPRVPREPREPRVKKGKRAVAKLDQVDSQAAVQVDGQTDNQPINPALAEAVEQSIPHVIVHPRIYDLYRELRDTELVRSKKVTVQSMEVFCNLLNECSPKTPEETACRAFVRCMYYYNRVGFLKYIGLSRNRVSALVLYTESKNIATFLGLRGVVHIRWNDDTSMYTVEAYIPRDLRQTIVNDTTMISEEQASKILESLAATGTIQRIPITQQVPMTRCENGACDCNEVYDEEEMADFNACQRTSVPEDQQCPCPDHSQCHGSCECQQLDVPEVTATNQQPSTSWSDEMCGVQQPVHVDQTTQSVPATLDPVDVANTN